MTRQIFLNDIDRYDFKNIDGYIKNRKGYKALENALNSLTPDTIIEEVKKSGLRGRGGAGFPTGMKWGFVPKDPSVPKYLCCNADESEPGTFKDRLIMEKLPHLLLEGMIISCYALNIHKAYLYIRGEMAEVIDIMDMAIEEAYSKGFLGKNILNKDFNLDLYTHPGAGAYICGEETGLINSLEGKRGYPRIKPPFPAIKGLFGGPTVVNNVETLACVPFIINEGADEFLKIGVKGSSGTKLYCLSGCVNRPGIYEFPMGMPLKELIYEHGGGIKNNRKLKGVIPGGSSMPILTPDQIDVTMDFDSLPKIGSMLGSAGVIVMDDSICMVDACLNLLMFYKHESCGQCTPCREGVPWLNKIINRIEHGKGEESDIDMILDICDNIEGKTVCPFGEAAVWPTRAFVTKYRTEFEDHIREKRCALK